MNKVITCITKTKTKNNVHNILINYITYIILSDFDTRPTIMKGWEESITQTTMLKWYSFYQIPKHKVDHVRI